MTGLALALLSAVAYGASDFAGGMLSRRAHFVLVGWVGQACSALVAFAVVAVVRPSLPGPATVGWAVLAGAGAVFGTLALYHGLAVGNMAVAGPLSAVAAAGIPVLVDLAAGGPMPLFAMVGVVAALPGIWFTSTTGTRTRLRGAKDGLFAGVGFAILFIGLDRAGDAAGPWPVALSQATSLTVLTFLAVAHRRRGPRPTWTAVIPGVLGVGATQLYFLSTQHAPLAVAAVVTSLYPAATVALAALLLGERTTRTQNAGLVLCGVAVVAFAIT